MTIQNARFRLACAFWIAVSLLLFTLYISGIPASYRSIIEQPTGRVTDDPAVLRVLLGQLGLPAGLYTATRLLQRAVPALAIMVMGLFLFWRKAWPERDKLDSPWGLLGLSLVLVWIGTGGGNFQGDLEFISFNQPVLAHLGRFLAVLTVVAYPILFYTFPDGRFTPRWTRWAALLLLLVSIITTYFPGWQESLPWIGIPLIFTFIYAPAARYRQASPGQRLQMKWGLLGIIATPSAWLINGALVTAMPDLFQTTPAGLRNEILVGLALFPLYLMGSVGIGVAVLRSRLWDIDVIIRRTLVYSLLTAVLTLLYFGSVVSLQQLFGDLSGQSSPVAIVLSTLLIAALFSPLRRWVQAAIDRRFFRRKYDAALTLAAFAQTARDEVNLDALATELAHVVKETMQSESVTLWLKPAASRQEINHRQ